MKPQLQFTIYGYSTIMLGAGIDAIIKGVEKKYKESGRLRKHYGFSVSTEGPYFGSWELFDGKYRHVCEDNVPRKTDLQDRVVSLTFCIGVLLTMLPVKERNGLLEAANSR
jgi:hypothetical protein